MKQLPECLATKRISPEMYSSPHVCNRPIGHEGAHECTYCGKTWEDPELGNFNEKRFMEIK